MSKYNLRLYAWIASIAVVAVLSVFYMWASHEYIGVAEGPLQAIQAPSDVIVESLEVKVGDAVKKKQLLGKLTDINLEIELTRLERTLASYKVKQALSSEVGLYRSFNTELDSLSKELSLLQQKKQKLTLYSTIDGIVGSIDVRVGDNVSKTNPIMTIYGPAKYVRAFVSELSYHTSRTRTEYEIRSATNPSKSAKGKLISIGNRIVQYPIHLDPTQVSWGRELYVDVVDDTIFLVNEKVYVIGKD